MRFIDFLVFYPMANIKRKKLGGLTWSSSLRRAVFLAGLNITLLLFIVLEVICYVIFRINLFDSPYVKILILVFGMLIAQLFSYIYVTKGRYDFIVSSSYKPFTLNITAGVAICFLIFIFSFVGGIATALIVNLLLAH